MHVYVCVWMGYRWVQMGRRVHNQVARWNTIPSGQHCSWLACREFSLVAPAETSTQIDDHMFQMCYTASHCINLTRWLQPYVLHDSQISFQMHRHRLSPRPTAVVRESHREVCLSCSWHTADVSQSDKNTFTTKNKSRIEVQLSSTILRNIHPIKCVRVSSEISKWYQFYRFLKFLGPLFRPWDLFIRNLWS